MVGDYQSGNLCATNVFPTAEFLQQNELVIAQTLKHEYVIIRPVQACMNVELANRMYTTWKISELLHKMLH